MIGNIIHSVIKAIGIKTTSYCSAGSGGIDIYVQGMVNSSNGSFTDHCAYNDSQVVEYYCNGTDVENTIIPCPYGCSKGSCMNQTVPSGCIVDSNACSAAKGLPNALGECERGPSRAMQTNLACPAGYSCTDLYGAMSADGFGVCCSAANQTKAALPDYVISGFSPTAFSLKGSTATLTITNIGANATMADVGNQSFGIDVQIQAI